MTPPTIPRTGARRGRAASGRVGGRAARGARRRGGYNVVAD